MRRFRRFRRTSRKSRPRVQHSPSTIGSVPANVAGTLVLAVVPRQDAGTSATSSRRDTLDRDRTCGVGSKVYSINFDVSLRSGTSSGYVEYVVWKAERQFATPAIATNPIPANIDCQNNGCQQAYRLNMPGWIMKHGIIPYSAETSAHRNFSVNLAKFKKAGIRDGDYIGITVFNRTGAAVTHDVQMRYYEYI